MKKAYQFLLALGVAAASLSSCSRANYAVNTTTPTAESVQIATSASDAAASSTATVSATMPTEVIAPAREAAAALAHHVTAAQVKATAAVAAPAEAVAAAPKVAATKAERRALRHAAIRQLAASPKEAAAEGKSQTTALILCILLGSIGVHQFYLGYTGRGILRIALALTSFLIVPAIVNLVLYILDIIKIVNGTLKPRNGEYAKKFNN